MKFLKSILINNLTERIIEMKGKLTIVLILLMLGGLVMASRGINISRPIQSSASVKLYRHQNEIWALRRLCGQLVIQVNLSQDRIVQIETILRSKSIKIPDSNTQFVKISRRWSNNRHETIEMHRITKDREIIVKPSGETITKPFEEK